MRTNARRRAAAGTALSAAASLLVFANPLLAGVFISRLIRAASLPAVAPVVVGMAAVKGTRMLLRAAAAKLLRGRERAPVYLLQAHIGHALWWLEPIFHSWGAAGMAVSRVRRWMFRHRLISRGLLPGRPRRRLPEGFWRDRIAASAAYYLSDSCVTLLAGAVYFYTRNRLLSLLPGLLPAVGVLPWFAERLGRAHRPTARRRGA